MVYRPIAYSLVCGILGSLHNTPRGIERIDFGYASHLFENWPEDCVGLLPTPWGLRYFPRERILRARDMQAAMWGEYADEALDADYQNLRARYLGQSPERKKRSFGDPLNIAGHIRAAKLLLAGGFDLGKPVSALPQGTIYLDVGHNGLAMPFMHRWLDARPDVRSVFMVHDAIPAEYPELVAARSVRIHTLILDTTAKRAHSVIVPTPSAKQSVHRELARRQAPDIPIHSIGLPINDAFRGPVPPDDSFAGHPYFLVCGAIEARKNPLLLLQVWRDLVLKLGDDAPRLILAGRPDHGSADTMDQISRSKLLNRHVFVASGLSTPVIARLMAGARAVLMPSFAEGFGLPPVEALSLGTPAVLSDISAHRDAAGEFGIFLNPTDGPGWRDQIIAMTRDTPDYLATKQRVAQFRPQDWPGYMHSVEALLRDLA